MRAFSAGRRTPGPRRRRELQAPPWPARSGESPSGAAGVHAPPPRAAPPRALDRSPAEASKVCPEPAPESVRPDVGALGRANFLREDYTLEGSELPGRLAQKLLVNRYA